MMKYIFTCLAFFSFGIGVSKAQGDPAKREEKIQALYVAYITQEIRLTEDEAKLFWPVHALYNQEIVTANTNQNELERQQATLNIRKKYQDRFIKILGVDRTNNFFKTDAGFRDKMIERLRKMRQQRNNSGGMMNRQRMSGF